MKEGGFNAIRSAHNPCSEEIIEACDKYGVYLIDETWDMWYHRKSKYDYANEFEENYREDLLQLAERDYNHPSVIMYSIGNEVSEPAEEKGVRLTQEMTDILHQADPSRLVTAGFNLMIIANAAKGKQMYSEDGGLDQTNQTDMSRMNSTVFNMIASMTGTGMNKAANGKKADQAISPALDLLDIAGYNYASGRYKEDLKKHPERLIFGSETFPQCLPENWKMVESFPNVIGDFMWTAWDYLGEAGLGAWSYEPDAKGFQKKYPWLLADAGVYDILGDPTGEALLTKVIWTRQMEPEIAVRPCNHPDETLIKAVWRGTNAIPSWSWNGCDGNRVIVEVYANAYRVELFLNGNCIGKKKTNRYQAVFRTKYESGELKAVSYGKDGTKLGETVLLSATQEIEPKVRAESQDPSDEIRFFHIEMQGENGVVDANSDALVSISVEGGELLGFGSANPKTEDSYVEGKCHTWHGRALAVVRKQPGETIHITAE